MHYQAFDVEMDVQKAIVQIIRPRSPADSSTTSDSTELVENRCEILGLTTRLPDDGNAHHCCHGVQALQFQAGDKNIS